MTMRMVAYKEKYRNPYKGTAIYNGMDSRYQDGKIYKIVDSGNNKCYFGSTVGTLSQRLAKHKTDYALHRQGKKPMMTVYRLFDEFHVENCMIELVEAFPCNSKSELTKREGYHIKNSECVNRKVEGRTLQEWYDDNAERLQEKRKEHYRQNMATIKAKQLEYREGNKEAWRERAKAYREANRDKLYECITCPTCGGTYARHHKARHQRSLKHTQAAGPPDRQTEHDGQ
jgi:hypothetical protein